MKRFFLLLLVLLLTSSPVLAATYTVDGTYTLAYDETRFVLNNTQYLSEPEWRFMLYDNTALLDACIDAKPYYGDLSLYKTGTEQVQAYIDAIAADYSDFSPVYVETLSLENGVSFVIHSMKDETSTYYYAETVIRGYGINFKLYYLDDRNIDNALLDVLKEILGTFQPIF